VSERSLHARRLYAALLAASVFYFCAPVVYAYFSEVTLSYAHVPRWFARTVPARVTAYVFSRYNVGSPIAARLSWRASCELVDEGATRRPGCAHEIRTGDVAYGPPGLKLAPGRYLAGFQFSGSRECAGGTADLLVATIGRFGNLQARYRAVIEPGARIEVPFTLNMMDAALGNVRFTVVGVSQCVVLFRLGWREIPTVPAQASAAIDTRIPDDLR